MFRSSCCGSSTDATPVLMLLLAEEDIEKMTVDGKEEKVSGVGVEVNVFGIRVADPKGRDDAVRLDIAIELRCPPAGEDNMLYSEVANGEECPTERLPLVNHQDPVDIGSRLEDAGSPWGDK